MCVWIWSPTLEVRWPWINTAKIIECEELSSYISNLQNTTHVQAVSGQYPIQYKLGTRIHHFAIIIRNKKKSYLFSVYIDIALCVSFFCARCLCLCCSISIWFYASKWNFINRNQSKRWDCVYAMYFFFFIRIKQNIMYECIKERSKTTMNTKHIIRLVYIFPFDPAIPLNVSQSLFHIHIWWNFLFVCAQCILLYIHILSQSLKQKHTHTYTHHVTMS